MGFLLTRQGFVRRQLRRLLSSPSDTDAEINTKEVVCAVVLGAIVCNLAAVGIGLVRDDTLLWLMGSVFSPLYCALAVRIFWKKRVGAVFSMVFAAAMLFNITWFDLAQLALRRRGWFLYIFLVEALLRMRDVCPRWVPASCVAFGCVWVGVSEAELGYRFGLLDLPGSIPYDQRMAMGCAKPPCGDQHWQGPVAAALLQWAVLVGNYLHTKMCSDNLKEEAARMEAAIEATLIIAEDLAVFDLDLAEEFLNHEAKAGTLPDEVEAPFRMLVKNLRSYRPYLPQSLITSHDQEDLTEASECADDANTGVRRVSHHFTAVVSVLTSARRISQSSAKARQEREAAAAAAVSPAPSPGGTEPTSTSAAGTPATAATELPPGLQPSPSLALLGASTLSPGISGALISPAQSMDQDVFAQSFGAGAATGSGTPPLERRRSAEGPLRRAHGRRRSTSDDDRRRGGGEGGVGEGKKGSFSERKGSFHTQKPSFRGSPGVGGSLTLKHERVSLLTVGVDATLDVEADIGAYERYISSYRGYLDAAILAVKASKGVLDYFHGDRIYASFNAFRRSTSHSEAAINAAMSITAGFPNEACRCGVASGVTAVGTLGNEALMSPSVTGDLRRMSEEVLATGELLGLTVVCTGMTAMNVSMAVPLRALLHSIEYGRLTEASIPHPLMTTLYSMEAFPEAAEGEGAGGAARPSSAAACDEWMYVMAGEPGAKWEVYNEAARLHHKRGADAATALLRDRGAQPHLLDLFERAQATAKLVSFDPSIQAAPGVVGNAAPDANGNPLVAAMRKALDHSCVEEDTTPPPPKALLKADKSGAEGPV